MNIITDFFAKLSEIPAGISESIKGLVASPISIVLVVLLIVCGVLILRFSKIKFTSKILTHVALAVTIAIILNMFVLFKMPQGGSVTLASMAPIFLIAFVYGPNIGVLAGLIFGVLNLILGGYVVHPVQVLLDYPVPFMLLGLAGYFPRHMNLGMIIATVLRFASHVISGFVFFAEYAPEGQSALLYSMIYNGSFLFVDMLIAIIIMNILPINKLAKSIVGEDLGLKYW